MDNGFEEIGQNINFIQHNGGLQLKKITESEYQFRAKVSDIHTNAGGSAHGGYIMTLLDSGMGNASHRSLGPGGRSATISLDVKFISAAKIDDVVIGTAWVLKKTRSLVFMRGELRCGDTLVATGEGIWKRLSPGT